MVEVTLPAKFFRDHLERDCSPGAIIVREGSRTITAKLSETDLEDIFSDAEYYADSTCGPSAESAVELRPSAQRTVAALKRQIPELSK